MIQSLNHLREPRNAQQWSLSHSWHISRLHKDGKLLRRFVRKERRGNGDWQYAKAQRCDGGKEPCIIDDSVLMRPYRSHSSQCKMHRWLQVSRVSFAMHGKAKGRKSESVIRLLYKMCRSDHTVEMNRAQWIHNRNKFNHPTFRMLLPRPCPREIERTALQSVDNIRKALFIRANFRVR